MANDAELTGLIVKIKADITEYQTKLNQMQTQTATASASVASKFDAMGATMAKAGVAMGAFAATAVNSAMAWGSAVNKLAKQTGMSAEETSKFLVIAKKTGIDTDTASMMFAKLAKSINSATKEQTAANAEGKTSGDIFTKLGVKTIDANGHMRKTGDIFADIKTKLAGMETGWQKTAIQMEIFGRTGYQLNGLLNMTAADMKDAIDMAQSLGLILDDKTAPAWAKLSKEITAAKGVLSSTGITIGNELMPMFKEVINNITSATKAFANMNPEVRSTIISVAKLGGEIGIAVTVLNKSLGIIGGVTEALGIMKMATWAAAGPWIALAGAIAYAITKLNEYQTRDRSWRGNKEAIDNPFTPGDVKERLEYKGMGDFDKRADEESLNKIIPSQPKETPPPDLFIGGGSDGGSGSKGTKEKTELQKYLEQLKDVEDILNRQSELGEINKDQVKSSLEAQLEGLKNVTVGQDEELDKERAIYDLKTKLRQVERDQIDIAKAKSDRDYAAQTITEAQYFAERKKEIQDQINLEVEGSAKRYNAEKELQDLINTNSEKQLAQSLSKISSDQTLASNNLKIESEQLRHKQAMSKIGNLEGDTAASLKSAIDAEKAIVDAQYAIDLKEINAEIDLYTQAGEKKTDELRKAIIERTKLQQNYNNAILVMDDNLAEKQKQLEQNKIDANNATISALIKKTKSGQDILKDMWFQFVDQIVAKMFSINTESNIFSQLLGGLFGGSSVANTGQFTLSGQTLSGPVMPNGSFTTIAGARASGGPVEAGKTYIVGEKRPELFIPNTDGIIMPDLSMARTSSNSNNASGGNSQMVSVSISQTFQSLDPTENMRLAKAQNASLKSEILNAIKTETAWRSAVKGAAK